MVTPIPSSRLKVVAADVTTASGPRAPDQLVPMFGPSSVNGLPIVTLSLYSPGATKIVVQFGSLTAS